jgi:fido (protein-threonine AMPylation protein)
MQNFDEYIRQGEPSQKEKAQIWQTAIGLQDVDGLKVSDYLIETAKENIEGKITIDEVQYRIDNYYKQQKKNQHIENDRTEEADTVSSRISKILSNDTFSFSPVEYIAIHRQLFTGIYKFAGKIRDYNISKNEWVLNGKSVFYANATEISATLDYDFNTEKKHDYQNTDFTQSIQHIAQFISSIWQIHAFGEGNTRTTAVFAIKYLRSFGFKIDNEMFAKHSWYFRNALVRANYNDWTNNIHATKEFLMKFFGNLLLGENNELKNRYIKVDWVKDVPVDSQNGGVNGGVNSKNGGVFSGVNLLQRIIIDLMLQNSRISVVEIANQTSKPRRTIENNVKKLKELKIIIRIGSDKTGEWKVVKP